MKTRTLITVHVLVWLVLLLKDFLIVLVNQDATNQQADLSFLLIEIGYTVVAITAFYGSYFLIARLLIQKPKQLWLGIANVLSVLLLTTGVRFIVEFGFMKPVLGFDNYVNNVHFTWAYFVKNAVLYYWSYMLYGLLYGFAENYFLNQKRQQEREQALLQAEMAFLRSQVNPHFLFNSINDVYALALTRPEQAPPASLKLAELLRYALYSSQMPLVPLENEISY